MSQSMSPTERERLEEDLVAYLDGEMDLPGSREIENRLAREPEVRRQLQRLQQSWDLLDRLPRSHVDDTFVRTTVEMLAVRAEEELAEEQKREPIRRAGIVALVLGAAAAAAVGGFALARWQWPNPNEQLARDLPVLQHLDELRQADSVEFLRQMHEAGLFTSGEVSTESTSEAQPPEEQRHAE